MPFSIYNTHITHSQIHIFILNIKIMITLSFLFREGEGTRVLGHVGQFGNVGSGHAIHFGT